MRGRVLVGAVLGTAGGISGGGFLSYPVAWMLLDAFPFANGFVLWLLCWTWFVLFCAVVGAIVGRFS
jgi:hypothetical protein